MDRRNDREIRHSAGGFLVLLRLVGRSVTGDAPTIVSEVRFCEVFGVPIPGFLETAKAVSQDFRAIRRGSECAPREIWLFGVEAERFGGPFWRQNRLFCCACPAIARARHLYRSPSMPVTGDPP
jgi:hypothetical protein